MKIALVFLLTLFATTVSAQHCPFDGISIIIVKLNENQTKQTITSLKLKEIVDKNVGKCSYSKKQINTSFISMDSLYQSNSWISDYEKRLGISLKTKGDYFVILNMGDVNCMIKQKDDFIYKKRKFKIEYSTRNRPKLKTVVVNETNIFSLCTSTTDWETIAPVILN